MAPAIDNGPETSQSPDGVLPQSTIVPAFLAAATGLGMWLRYRHRLQRARNRGAKANLRHALMAEQVAWSHNKEFLSAMELGAVLPRLPPLDDYPVSSTAMIPWKVYVAVLDDAHVELSAVAGKKLYSIVQSNEAGNPSTRYGVTAVSAGRPDPAKITGLTW